MMNYWMIVIEVLNKKVFFSIMVMFVVLEVVIFYKDQYENVSGGVEGCVLSIFIV